MNENTLVMGNQSEYGAFELKRLYPRNYSLGMTIAVLIHLLLIGTYIFIESITREDDSNIATVRILKYSELGPPPSLDNNVQQQLAVSAPAIKPNIGIPTPVPDAEAPKEQTIATQQEMNKVAAPIGEGSGGGVQITQDLKVEAPNDAPPDINAFVPVEKMPQVVVSVPPVYPDLAKRAGIEGTVYVKILVSKEGKPIKTVVIKSDSEVFNQPAIDAAMKFVFTPAIQHKAPVMVWVVVPFRFRLNN
ncbi:MAG: TonB family protein [Bacteroidetes bacterium]|nr:TonB family protein [Bacteroidota bacterium]